MAHQAQMDFVAELKKRFPANFHACDVLEIGSLDINGSIRRFFDDCYYIGLDIGEGPGVDMVCRGEEFAAPDEAFDTVASCECFEHNPQWAETFLNMVRMVREGGLVFFTCATTGRGEHGTRRTTPDDAPYCGDYYRNLTVDDFLMHEKIGPLVSSMTASFFDVKDTDLRFYGVK